ncbi:AI-2E family transporter [Sphingobacterium sp. N143]|uniref:AI-2E family transporter n=1 Tax=Sphingobacterium sp. N143 TaxID=2746727 RepID=UPI00257550F5|nr:AI-2E family transporter [Sphingobacterium sp. N143]MDM1293198.1 AI-2E family transporter [Sphingobacterium sp. N143]
MKYKQINNNSINQIMLIVIILLICILIFTSLFYYLPGFLGAITLYVLFRKVNFRLTVEKGWNKSIASILLILLTIIFLVGPLYLLINYMVPQVTDVINNKNEIIQKFDSIKTYFKDSPYLSNIDLSDTALIGALQRAAKFIPNILNSVAEVGVNVLVALFVLYFMLVSSKQLEQTIYNAIPFSKTSKTELWKEFDMMVKSNAIGIPILAICQGIVAGLGYWFFGLESPIFLGILTAVATIIPILGTMVVYLPAALFLLANGQSGNAIGLALYGIIIIGSIDNILRFTILKKLGDVHPLITVFGVLLGLNLFGMLGLIFGPLILSCVGVLLKVYGIEFGRSTPAIVESTSIVESDNPPHEADTE